MHYQKNPNTTEIRHYEYVVEFNNLHDEDEELDPEVVATIYTSFPDWDELEWLCNRFGADDFTIQRNEYFSDVNAN